MFHGIKYLIVSLVFSHLGFWGGNLFLIAPFPDLCLLVPFYENNHNYIVITHLDYIAVITTSLYETNHNHHGDNVSIVPRDIIHLPVCPLSSKALYNSRCLKPWQR